MPIAPTFKAAIIRLTELAGPEQPGYVSVRAASQLANLLSPANPKHGDILYELNGDPSAPFSTPASRAPAPPTENPCAEFLVTDEQPAEDDEETEDDESEGADQDDEPP